MLLVLGNAISGREEDGEAPLPSSYFLLVPEAGIVGLKSQGGLHVCLGDSVSLGLLFF